MMIFIAGFIAGAGITALIAWRIHKHKMAEAGREVLQFLEASKSRR